MIFFTRDTQDFGFPLLVIFNRLLRTGKMYADRQIELLLMYVRPTVARSIRCACIHCRTPEQPCCPPVGPN